MNAQLCGLTFDKFLEEGGTLKRGLPKGQA